jgi:hypothetical protein
MVIMNRTLLIQGGAVLVIGGIAYWIIKEGINGVNCESITNPFECVDKGCYFWDNNCHENKKPNGDETTTVQSTAMEMRNGVITGPLSGVLVWATNEETGQQYADLSDEEGIWTLEKMTPGFYNIVASKNGYKDDLNYHVDWSRPGEWIYSHLWSALEKLPLHRLYWKGSASLEKTFDLKDPFGITGTCKMEGKIVTNDCWNELFRTVWIYAIKKSGAEVKILETGYMPYEDVEVYEIFDIPTNDPVMYVRVEGCCGDLVLCNIPNLREIDIIFKRIA